MNPHHGPAGRAPSFPCLRLERWPVTYPELNLAQLARGLGLTPDLLTIAVLSGHGSTCFPRTTQSSPERNGRPKLKAPRSDLDTRRVDVCSNRSFLSTCWVLDTRYKNLKDLCHQGAFSAGRGGGDKYVNK